MEEWHAQMANEFRNRDNPKPMGCILGKVEAIGSDWLVTIRDGKFRIDKTNGYICNQILRHEAEYTYEHSGKTTVNGCMGGPETNYKSKGSGKLYIKPIWRVGDLVKVTPDESGQHYFIDDIVRQ